MDLQEQYVMSVSLACSHGVAWDKKTQKTDFGGQVDR